MKYLSIYIMLIFMLLNVKTLHAQNNIEDGLLACFPFNGNANDESGLGNQTFVHGAKLTADHLGKANCAYSFDGKESYIDIKTKKGEAFTMKGNVSFFSWIKKGRNGILFFGKTKTNKDLISKIIGYNPLPAERALHDFFESRIPDDEWCHIGFTYSACSQCLKLFFNGRMVKSVKLSCAASFRTGNEIKFGYSDRDSTYFKGAIDDVRFYDICVNDEVAKILYKDLSLPKLNVLDNSANIFHGASYLYSLEISSETPVSSIKIFKNDSLVASISRFVLQNKKGIYQHQINLDEGANELHAEVRNKDGVQKTRILTTEYHHTEVKKVDHPFADDKESDSPMYRNCITESNIEGMKLLKVKVDQKEVLPDSISSYKISQEKGKTIYYFKVARKLITREFTLIYSKSVQRYKLCVESYIDGWNCTTTSEYTVGAGSCGSGRKAHPNLKQTKNTSDKGQASDVTARFHLIAATYSDFVIANQAAKLYQQKGYASAKVISEGGKHRISIRNFSSEEKAQQEAKTIGFSVWVMKAK